MNIDPLSALDPDQTTAATRLPLPRRALGRGTLLLLWTLRLYVAAAIPVVIYAFIRAVGQ